MASVLLIINNFLYTKYNFMEPNLMFLYAESHCRLMWSSKIIIDFSGFEDKIYFSRPNRKCPGGMPKGDPRGSIFMSKGGHERIPERNTYF